MKSRKHLHVAVEGCVGVGKTTLATKLATVRKAELVLEEFEKNPFLSEFYSDPAGNVFETEMQFLLLHYHQLKKVPGTSARETITDFTFFKDLVFAGTNLPKAQEKEMFIEVYEFLLARLPAPDLIIYLKGSDELIVDRIRKRNRSIEMKIDVAYFKRLRKAYDRFFAKIERTHVINADRFDCLSDTGGVHELCKIIDALAPLKAARR